MNLCLFVLLAFVSIPCSADDDQENLKKLAIANNDLALNLHRILSSGSSENIFFSPFSISTVFSMLFYGARGDTAKELRKALGYDRADLSTENVPDAFHTFLTQVLQNSPGSYTLKSANAILVDKDLQLVPGYKNEVEDLYQAMVREVDFSGNSNQIVNEINQWVKEKTNGLIDSLLDKLSQDTVMFLLNAIYFKGTWKTQFDPKNTKPQTFYNDGLESGAKEVPFMHMTARLRHAWLAGYQALELWYKGENVSMLILLPDGLPDKRDGLRVLLRDLTLEKLDLILDRLIERRVILALPKFKAQYSEELSDEMKSLGEEKIFSPGAADLSGITPSNNVFVSQVVHKAVIEVNEEGSEAAAVTGVSVGAPCADCGPIYARFLANHPFLYFILERGSGSNLILFMGQFYNN